MMTPKYRPKKPNFRTSPKFLYRTFFPPPTGTPGMKLNQNRGRDDGKGQQTIVDILKQLWAG
jgi:hypothetical protein